MTRIDYARMQRTHRLHKAALTRAKKKGTAAVIKACAAAVKEWNEIGCWPDDWHTWNIALSDAYSASWPANVPRLDDLSDASYVQELIDETKEDA